MAKRANLKSLRKDEVITLKISLDATDSVVWRRIVVPGHFTLEALHSVIQMTMGWQMSHLCEFRIGTKRYAEPSEYDEKPIGSLNTPIVAAIKDQKSFQYIYDFGDGWQHTIKVEKIGARDRSMNYPICIGGENACPPEDCGGVPGFANLKTVIGDPEHGDFDDMMTWLGGFYDPKSFDPNRINKDMLWVTDWTAEPNDHGLYRPFNSEEEMSF